jgi:hypothetical protein
MSKYQGKRIIYLSGFLINLIAHQIKPQILRGFLSMEVFYTSDFERKI